MFFVFVIVLVVVVVVVVVLGRVLVIVVVVCFLFLLFFFFLLLLSSLLLLLPSHFFLSLVAAEYRQIGCVFASFETLRGKNTINSDAFCISDAPNHGVYDVFLASGSNNHGIYIVFLGRHRAKTLVFAQFFGMLQEVIFPCRSHKTRVNYNVWGLILSLWQGGGASRMNSNLLNNQVTGLATLPFTS